MTRTRALQAAIAAGFPLGALGHGWYVFRHGLWYHGRAPDWAPVFWYALCAVDLVVPFMVWRAPRAGLLLATAVMVTTMIVNLTCFPRFEDGPNPVLLSLLGFGVFVLAATPWLWPRLGWWRGAAENRGESG